MSLQGHVCMHEWQLMSFQVEVHPMSGVKVRVQGSGLGVWVRVWGLGGQDWDGGPLRWDAADLHVGKGASSLAAAVRDRRGDDILQSVERDDEQRHQEGQQAQKEPHVDHNVPLADRGRGDRWRGGERWSETQKSPVIYWSDSSLIVIHQRNIHPRHPGWRREDDIYWETAKTELIFNITLVGLELGYH